jgi:hypothetical protein
LLLQACLQQRSPVAAEVVTPDLPALLEPLAPRVPQALPVQPELLALPAPQALRVRRVLLESI